MLLELRKLIKNFGFQNAQVQTNINFVERKAKIIINSKPTPATNKVLNDEYSKIIIILNKYKIYFI